MLNLIIPNWPAPKWIKAYTTTRLGGFSHPPYDSFNVATHVGDNLKNVIKNRQLLQTQFNLKKPIIWLNQKHRNRVISADSFVNLDADAIYSRSPQTICAVQTADCLPLLICSPSYLCVAAIHAGWRGLHQGIIEKTIQAFDLPPQDILVWLGPAIGPHAFTVGEEVFEAFVNKDPITEKAFKPLKNNSTQWHANLYQLAKRQLCQLGITAIYGGHYCTYSDKYHFFSYRRNHITGRMLNFIWINLP